LSPNIGVENDTHQADFARRFLRTSANACSISLSGRVLTESLRSHADDPLPVVEHQTDVSDPSAKGLRTVLQVQTVGGHRYFDVAGFADRTAGLEGHD
jgi:hypothetical protein